MSDLNYATFFAHWERVVDETLYRAPYDTLAPGLIGPFPATIWRLIYARGKLNNYYRLAEVCKSFLHHICGGRYVAVRTHRIKVLQAIASQLQVYNGVRSHHLDNDDLLNHWHSSDVAKRYPATDTKFIASITMFVSFHQDRSFDWLPQSAHFIMSPSPVVICHPSCCKSMVWIEHRRDEYWFKDVIKALDQHIKGASLNTTYIQVRKVRFRSRNLAYDLAREPFLRWLSPMLHEFWATCGEPLHELAAKNYPDDIVEIRWKVTDNGLRPHQPPRPLTPMQRGWLKAQHQTGKIDYVQGIQQYGLRASQIAGYLWRNPLPKLFEGVKGKQLTIDSQPVSPPLAPPTKRKATATLPMPTKIRVDDSDSDFEMLPSRPFDVCTCKDVVFVGYYCALCGRGAM
jgi:hypothetical protein